MKIENFGVEELSLRETTEINGGNPALAIGVGLALAGIFWAGVTVGYNLR